jgi:hypothetical protein
VKIRVGTTVVCHETDVRGRVTDLSASWNSLEDKWEVVAVVANHDGREITWRLTETAAGAILDGVVSVE